MKILSIDLVIDFDINSILMFVYFSIDKTKALSLIVHCADISHPAKDWNLHHRWTELLMEEFFRQVPLLGRHFNVLCLLSTSSINFIESNLVTNDITKMTTYTREITKAVICVTSSHDHTSYVMMWCKSHHATMIELYTHISMIIYRTSILIICSVI